MNYQHRYHAGNAADVFKHVVLIGLLELLQRKEKPLCIIDTHAGRGLYDLTSPEAQATKEYILGIQKIINAPTLSQPAWVQRYLEIIRGMQTPESYPGSPLLIQTQLRAMDRLICNELDADSSQNLRYLLKSDPRCQTHQRDAYEFLPAVLPPLERRGLILIDPPFEKTTELEDVFKCLMHAYSKFPQGVYAIWYPIKKQKSSVLSKLQSVISSVARDLPKLALTEKKGTLALELYLADPQKTLHTMLYGMGMVIVNPPYGFEDAAKTMLNWLCPQLALESNAYFKVDKI